MDRCGRCDGSVKKRQIQEPDAWGGELWTGKLRDMTKRPITNLHSKVWGKVAGAGIGQASLRSVPAVRLPASIRNVCQDRQARASALETTRLSRWGRDTSNPTTSYAVNVTL